MNIISHHLAEVYSCLKKAKLVLDFWFFFKNFYIANQAIFPHHPICLSVALSDHC